MTRTLIIIKIAMVIFLAEAIIMFGLSTINPIESPTIETFVDALALTLLCAPIIGYWIIRPFALEQFKTEDELREASRRNESILHAAGEGIFGIDEKGLASFFNPAAARMLGRTAEECLGRNCHELLHHSRPDGSPYPIEECPIFMALGDGRIHRDDSEVFWRADGSSFPVDYVSTPIIEQEKIIGAVVTFRDISERKQAEEEKNHMEIQLRHAQKLESIGQLAAGIAHEINTPTQFVSDNIRFLDEAFEDLGQLMSLRTQLIKAAATGPVPKELLSEEKQTYEDVDPDYLLDEIPKAIEQSREGLSRISKIVLAMKEFSHPGKEEKVPTDINSAILSTVEVSRNEWKYCAELVTELASDLPLVPCLPGEFNQVILNTIINAAHAIAEAAETGEGGMGTITIRTCLEDNWAAVSISDTGTGIPEEIQAKIFDPFFTTKDVGKGTGQGLSIAYSVIVDKHEGKIDLKSELGRGSTFIFRLPINPSTPSDDQDELLEQGAA